MGKTADLTVVQKTIIDTLHKEGKPQTFIAKEAGCSQSAVSKHVNRKLRTAALWGLSSRGGSRGGARGALAPVEIWLAPEVPLSCQSSLIYIKLSIGWVGSSFENQPAQRFLSTTTASAVFSVTVFVPFTGSTYSKL